MATSPDVPVFDPNSDDFPSRKALKSVKIPGAPEGAAWFWGKDDNLGRLNLLTPKRVVAAAKLIQSGEMVNLDLPADVPKVPAFGRQPFEHVIECYARGVGYDDLYSCNTQSGSQWDGFRHAAHKPSALFYNFTTDDDIQGPKSTPTKSGIDAWARHGIAARAVLLDYYTYAQTHDLSYDPNTLHHITFASLLACGRSQGLDIRPASQGGDILPGDILLIRSGFNHRYNNSTDSENADIARRPHAGGKHAESRYAGVNQGEEELDWLHDCYFAAVAGDAPAFEAWPSQEDWSLHEYLLSLWGCPIGEMWDLEVVAEKCREKGQWTFFLTSSPANVRGGVGSHINATAIF